ncbi:uncharacterized protein LACBIDRAFT_316958 [Laccaria bicolor S238N-H82]|uniref:Predicted protein n=1 Tax=Laccaria bicolor (strain S238N-H82 / ATCC MYA-4686) TaxID=486041 RepID=B0D419_LACBS|nr:uncharacterized protein LACBIDRAFT_316958 [Laccaria bicolor S238N-H82]EDR10499.1 predicted protein [Laccaria bicolor S238N-H82]|eukprot:XP_001878949.1 predicted protein [Laccaria bicolor S238N-H82]
MGKTLWRSHGEGAIEEHMKPKPKGVCELIKVVARFLARGYKGNSRTGTSWDGHQQSNCRRELI